MENIMRPRLLTTILITFAMLGLSACEDKPKTAGEKLDSFLESSSDAAKEATEKAKQMAKEACEKAKEKMETADQDC